ncbi:hypothetical protein ACRE_044080 [Hapsidospora chrysogenum ATCC 11550]|uniref:Uncharacterized protein n=1 Tax=Hapsidospora chrysogenum (strain ATCC 11550 / CBS 779.69 / DSM 880 / IAM 14645 / JCM 23072 / IMI 49137) TaxID=857340 RepID=A0A086T620_HAPC1|nr:hypothetical protein ACRE_044080 [Hapsidospora chrysogenum ATCC 11550]
MTSVAMEQANWNKLTRKPWETVAKSAIGQAADVQAAGSVIPAARGNPLANRKAFKLLVGLGPINQSER